MSRLSYTLTLFRELGAFARQRKVYWLVPLMVILVMFAILIGATNASAPFIYTLF